MITTQDIYIGNGEYIPAGSNIYDHKDKLNKSDMTRFKKLGVIADDDTEAKSLGIATDGQESMVKLGDSSAKSEDENSGTVESYGELTVEELKAICEEYGIEVSEDAKKPEIIALIEAHEAGKDVKGNEA